MSSSDGRVYGIGSNRYGQLGVGAESIHVKDNPIAVILPTQCPIKQIACGAHHSLILD
jgi:alpha-tubulin suppressor-like RCC1 family protein